MWKRLHAEYPLFWSDFKHTWLFSTDIWKTQISSFIKIRQVGAELFHADGQTWLMNMTKLVVAFRDVAKTPKKFFSLAAARTHREHNVSHCLSQPLQTECTVTANPGSLDVTHSTTQLVT